MNRLLKIFLFLFFLVTLLPLVQMNTGVITPKKLNGFSMPKRPAVPTVGKFLDGSFQKDLERWFMRRNGLWAHLVRLESQLNFDMFGQISQSYKSTLARGEQEWLFQTEYLSEFNRTKQPSDDALYIKVRQLRHLQDLLGSHGVKFLLLISANKTSVHPEVVPAKFHSPGRENRLSMYQRMLKLLRSEGVNYLDAVEFFKSRRIDDYSHFSISGSHWNDVGACLITRELTQRISKLLGKQLRDFSCQPIKMRQPKHTDLDLVKIANLWDVSTYLRETPYPTTETIAQGNEYQPKLLIVGTSFVWSVLRFMDFHKVCRYNDFYYYYNRLRNYPSGRQHALNRATIDWSAEVLSNDVVVIEANSAILDSAGFEFVADAINNLMKIKLGRE